MTEKIFIIGLPRTGTTSLCMLFLELGYKVAHTAFNEKVFEEADVVADTPIFLDYPALDSQFSNSQFIYLRRDMSLWMPSIQRLLRSMRKKSLRDPHALHPEIHRCFEGVFPAFKTMARHEERYVSMCYLKHYQAAARFFAGRDNWLEIDVSAPDTIEKLTQFVRRKNWSNGTLEMPHVNRERRIRYWDDVVHPNKVSSF